MSTIKTNKFKEEPKLIEWGGDDPFTHTLVVGPTRCGKTSTILQPMIYSILQEKRRGKKVGLSVIEPKGDIIRMVKEMAENMGLKDELVYIDPVFPDETMRINVMKGDKADVAEATVAVLKSLFGKQDAFFATVQELSSRKVTLLLKELYDDNMDIMDVLANLRDVSLLQNNVEKLRQSQGTTDLVQFFDNELLGTGNMAEKYRQFIVGLRAQLENITSNEHLRAIVTGKSDIDLDEHFLNGNILAVNTALGKLGRAGDAFGMFMAMHLQLATFRRPGEERTRVPHYLIIDEYSRYINPDVERFLSIAASYRVALIAAIQSLGQLELETGTMSGRAVKRAILTSTRNKIVFGGLEYEDAEEVAKIMGKNVIKERQRMFDGGILANILPKSYKDQEEEKERFYSTFLMDGLPRFHYVHKLTRNVTAQEPGIGVGDFVPRNWLEIMQQEDEAILNQRKPPFWKWRERAVYNVNHHRKEQEMEFRDRAKKLLEEDPFVQEQKDDISIQITTPSPLNEKVKGKQQVIDSIQTDTEPTLPIIFSLKRNVSEPVEEISEASKPEVVKETIVQEEDSDWSNAEIKLVPKQVNQREKAIIENAPSSIKQVEVEVNEVPSPAIDLTENHEINKQAKESFW